MNPLGGCPLRYTHKNKASLDRLHVPWVNPVGEVKLINTEVERSRMQLRQISCPTSRFRSQQTEAESHRLMSDWEILAWACSLSWWAQQAVTSASWLQSAGTTLCLMHYSWEGAESSVLFGRLCSKSPPPSSHSPSPSDCHLSLCWVNVQPAFLSHPSVDSVCWL